MTALGAELINCMQLGAAGVAYQVISLGLNL
jgi:hypothetical protein